MPASEEEVVLEVEQEAVEEAVVGLAPKSLNLKSLFYLYYLVLSFLSQFDNLKLSHSEIDSFRVQ